PELDITSILSSRTWLSLMREPGFVSLAARGLTAARWIDYSPSMNRQGDDGSTFRWLRLPFSSANMARGQRMARIENLGHRRRRFHRLPSLQQTGGRRSRGDRPRQLRDGASAQCVKHGRGWALHACRARPDHWTARSATFGSDLPPRE